MSTDVREQLRQIQTFPSLVKFLRDELDWPVDAGDFEELTFDYEPEELGIDAANAAKIDEIKRLRPLVVNQPWGIFFVKFEPKRLPVVALRRILAGVVLKKRATASSAEQPKWAEDDLLFISNYGNGDERRISFAHFFRDPTKNDLPTLKVIAWDDLDTPLHLEHTADVLVERLAWPTADDEWDGEEWRRRWRSAFELRHREVVTTAKMLAERLASLARGIRAEILRVLEIETDEGTVTRLLEALKEALIHDLDADGFADMYAQTIAYGLLSARIVDPHKMTADDFAGHMRTNPFLGELMETFLMVGGRRAAASIDIDFDELGVSEVVELLDNTRMEDVVRDFGDQNPEDDPVIHFYELFLKEYDAKKRMQRGVFYTPRPVVSYIVRAVDESLRKHFGLEDGLADVTTWDEMTRRHPGLARPAGIAGGEAFVQILDPATGTGTFLVEVVDLIHKTLIGKWADEGHDHSGIDALWNDYVPRHLLPRLYGYEILMAPYAIAHLKIGLKLHETGYDFATTERARIYLTNALEPAHDFSGRLAFALPALAHEASAVNAVKSASCFTVITGNPPYSQMSQNLGPAERELVAPYRSIDGQRLVERGAIALERNLQDDYVKFVRLGETCVEHAGAGVVGMISNHAYLTNPTLRGMRWHISQTFDRIEITDLHGNSKIKEVAPGGIRDENVFDIQQGVAVGLFSKLRGGAPARSYAELWGTRADKYAALARRATAFERVAVRPTPPTFLLVPQDEALREEYAQWTSLTDIYPLYGSAITTARDGVVVDFTDAGLLDRARRFQDSTLSDKDLLEDLGIRESALWKMAKARKDLRHVDIASSIVDVDYRPFDRRRLLYNDALVTSPRHPTMDQMARPDSLALAVSRQQGVPGFRHAFVSRIRFDEGLVSNRSREKTACFPVYVYNADDGLLSAAREDNINWPFANRLAAAVDADARGCTAAEIASYVYAICHSPGYRERYASLLKADFPRVPPSPTSELFAELARLGDELIHIHLLESVPDSEHDVVYSGPPNPAVGRSGWANDAVWLDVDADGGTGAAVFLGVQEAVWNFEIGAYGVCQKWLKDRRGRTLSMADIAHYRCIVVALGATLRLMHEIDAIINSHGGWPYAFGPGDD